MTAQVQNLGLAKITALLAAATFWFQWGTGSAAAKTATTVTPGTTTEARVSATMSAATVTVANDTLRATGTITAAGARTITEVGLFDSVGSGSPPTGGNMDIYCDFAAVGVANGESIAFTMNTTFA